MRGWYKRLDDHLHFPCTVVLTFAIAGMPGVAAGFPRHLPGSIIAPDDEPEMTGPLAELAEKTGVSAAAVAASLAAFDRTLTDMQRALDNSPWLAGETFSLADIAFAPYVTRLDCLALEWLWDERPRVADWYARIRARPAYVTAIANWLKPPEAMEAMRSNGGASPG